MNPEYYTDALQAARLHKYQDMLDNIYAAEFALSPSGFKNPSAMMKDRHKQKKDIQNKIMMGFGEESFASDPKVVSMNRFKLKSMFQKELKEKQNV